MVLSASLTATAIVQCTIDQMLLVVLSSGEASQSVAHPEPLRVPGAVITIKKQKQEDNRLDQMILWR